MTTIYLCSNIGNCEKADSKERIQIPTGTDPICPECDSPLMEVPPTRSNTILLLLLAAFSTCLFGGMGYWFFASEPTPPEQPPPIQADCKPKPLLMADKTTLYQRVLTRLGAVLVDQPGSSNGNPQLPFSRYYVYSHQTANGEEWLNVGANANCKTDGWLNAATTVPWKQQLTLAFTNPAGRDRVLFFEDRTDLEQIIESPTPATTLDPLLRSVQAGRKDPRVVAIEPENFIDISKQFYLLPILDFEEIHSGQGYPVQLLQVASISKSPDSASGNQSIPTPTAAVVFVIDSTISMGPYIERTKEAVQRIYERFKNSPLGNQTKFGLVGYRSNIRAVPKLEYDAKLFADPNKVPDEQDFLGQIKDLKEATVSSSEFDEDAFAGLMLALDAIDWSKFTGRYIIHITDAGALDANDPLSKTKKSPADIRSIAKDKNIVLYTIHLKTLEGNFDHAKAEQQYRQLTANVLTVEPLYYSVDIANAVSIDFFGTALDCLTNSIVYNVNALTQTSSDKNLLQFCPPTAQGEAFGNQLNKMREDVKLLGHALRLEYLGRLKGTQAPPVFKGWIADHDAKAPVRQNVDIRILLSKNELSSLTQGVQAILDAAQAGRSSPTEFYRRLRTFASGMVRDPNLALQQQSRIAEMGILGEYLDGLPYKSAVMNLDQDTWASWSASQQEEFINGITHKLERYRYYNSDQDLWVRLAEGSEPGESVYPVPLDALP